MKWGGLGVSALLLGVWIGSVWWNAAYWSGGWEFGWNPGRFFVQHTTLNMSPDGHIWRTDQWDSWEWWFYSPGNLQFPRTYVPIWLPVTISALITVFAWRLDTLARRRAKLGACPKCSYSRTGLALSAVCPECGATAPTGSSLT